MKTALKVRAKRKGMGLDREIAAAIAFVLQAEHDRRNTLDRQKITLRETDVRETWTALGKMRALASRLS